MYSIETSEKNQDVSQKTSLICLVGILVLSAILRFWCLTNNPPVTPFEKLHADSAYSFAQGKLEVDGKPLTFFSRKLFYPPLFHFLSAVIFKNLAKAIVTVRFISGLVGILTTFAIFLIGYEMASRRTGLYSSLLYAIYPYAVEFNRFAIPQNLAIFWLIFAFLFLILTRMTKKSLYLYLSAIFIAISTLTVYSSVLFVILLLIVTQSVDKKYTKRVLLISLGPVVLLFLIMLVFRFKIVLYSLTGAVLYGVTETDIILPSYAFVKGLWGFIFHDWFIFLGVLGICFYQSRYPWYLLMAIIATGIGGFSGQAGYGTSLYPALTMALPFVILGTGRMTQVIIDNFTSLVNAMLGFKPSSPDQKLSPGKILALIGFVLFVLIILYYDLPQVKISFNTV